MKFILLKSLFEVERLVNHLLQVGQPYAIDLETSGLNPWRDGIVGVSLAFNKKGAVYIPIRHKYGSNLSASRVMAYLKPLLEKIPSLIYNIAFDGEFLLREGINIHPASIDVSLLTYVNGKEVSNKLSTQAESVLGFEVWDFSDFMVRVNLPKNTSTIAEAPAEYVTEYCGRDALATYLLWDNLWPRLKDDKIYKIESLLLPSTIMMRRNGVLVDKEFLKLEALRMAEEREKVKNLIFQQASQALGEPVTLNLASTQQKADLLFKRMRLPVMEKSKKTGAPSTSENALAELKWYYPIVYNMVAFNGINKLMGSYLNKLPDMIESDGRLHTSFNQTGVVTGRYSSSDPNLQNIPNFSNWVVKGGDSVTCNVRDAFTVPDGWRWYSYDYSQIEARLAAGVTRETELLQAFADGIDFHTKTASLVFGVATDMVAKAQRKLGKKLNFLLLYGGEAYKLFVELVKEMQVTREEAKHYRDLYYRGYPKMFRGASQIAKDAHATNSVQTIFGRRIPVPLLASTDRRLCARGERQAYNGVIQGSAADILKVGMIKMRQMIEKNYGFSVVRPFLTVHDETAYEVSSEVPPYEWMKDSLDTLKYERDEFPVMPAEVKVGTKWGSLDEKKKVESLEEFAKRVSGETKVSVRVPEQYGSGKTFILEMSSLSTMSRTKQELLAIKEFIQSKKGNNSVVIKLGTSEVVFAGTGISIEEKDHLILLSGGRFYEDVSDEELKSLGEN